MTLAGSLAQQLHAAFFGYKLWSAKRFSSVSSASFDGIRAKVPMLTVETMDTGLVKAGFAASFLLRWHGQGGTAAEERYALVDVGSSRDAAHVASTLRERGVDLGKVEWVFVTHVHLDHAGGAGLLLRDYLPAARVVVHHSGARHLLRPGDLEAGAQAAYGDSVFEELFGSLVPVPEDRVVPVRNGDSLAFADAAILDTPGHARHHYCLWFEAAGALFTGDTFGLSYPALATEKGPFLYPTTTPTAFEPEKLLQSIDRLAQLAPKIAYLTHFGPLAFPARHAAELKRRIEGLVAVAKQTQGDAAALQSHFVSEYEAHGGNREKGLEWMAMDLELNARGLAHWLKVREASSPHA